MERLAADPPSSLDGIPVVSVTDFRRGAEERPRYLPAASLVEMDLGERGRVLARPSGTEPKLKIYVDVTAAVASGEEPGRMEGELRATADRLAAATVSVLDL
jgi:phosphomannomutase